MRLFALSTCIPNEAILLVATMSFSAIHNVCSIVHLRDGAHLQHQNPQSAIVMSPLSIYSPDSISSLSEMFPEYKEETKLMVPDGVMPIKPLKVLCNKYSPNSGWIDTKMVS